MRRVFVAAITFLVAASAAGATDVLAGNVHDTLTLTAAGPSSGPHGLSGQSGSVDIKIRNGVTKLKFSVSGLTPNAVHSAWLIFDTTKAPFSGAGATLGATDPVTGTFALAFPSTPATADISGFTSGVGIDPNGFLSDAQGAARFSKQIDYDITQSQAAPIVLRPAATQSVPEMDVSGNCVAGGPSALGEESTYMRTFETSGAPPYFQQTNGPLAPKLVRGQILMFMLIEHFDGLTHGHVAGAPFGSATTAPPGSACGDWAPRFIGLLSDFVSK
jgi:hypothetical protein